MLVEVKEPRSLGDYMVMPEMPSVYLILCKSFRVFGQ